MIQSTCCSIETIMLRQHGRAAGAGDREQVGEAGDLEAEVGARPCSHFVLQLQPAAAADVDLVEQRPVMASKPVAKTIASKS